VTEGKRQRGRDREERQRGETEGKSVKATVGIARAYLCP